MKFKLLALSAGVVVVGFLGTPSFATSPTCKKDKEPGTETSKTTAQYCLSKDYTYSAYEKCKCPNPSYKQDHTIKCQRVPAADVKFTCELP